MSSLGAIDDKLPLIDLQDVETSLAQDPRLNTQNNCQRAYLEKSLSMARLSMSSGERNFFRGYWYIVMVNGIDIAIVNGCVSKEVRAIISVALLTLRESRRIIL